ncbi:MAG: hypothetical protein L6416_09290, partial [Candidatus Omnitrophica bacterium]|nr:hypothetical protein [Candidatus Omnitrophota bacterium]
KKIQKIKKFTKADDELLDNIQSDIREECLNNDLIQVFFNFEKNKDFGNPFYPIIKQLLFSEDEIIKEIIEEVEDRGETKIEAEGREILEDFNNMPANEKAEKAHTWAEFVTQRTMGEYDLTQIFAHSFSLAQGWLQLLKSDKYYEFIAKAEKGFNENFRKGYVVLRAIAIESRKQSGLIAYKQIMQSKILSDFFCRDQKEEKKRLVGYIRELLASDNDIVRNIIKQVDANPKEWISGQAAQLLEAFNANQAYEDYDKVHTWAELAAIQTTGAYDLYQLLVHIINAAYLNMEALEKLSPEDKYYAETREALEKTLRNGYIILRAIEIASRDFVDFQDRSDVARINDVDFKEMRDFGDKDKYILKKLKERENIIVKRQLQPGKNASIYVAEHPGFGEVIIKILPYEIGLNYGVEERFEIASYFAKAYKSLSPFTNVLKFISFEKIGSAVIIEEFIEEFTREQMKAILTREGIKDSGVVEKTLRYIELESLLRIWLKSFELDKYKGLVIRDIMPQDIRYVKINGQWMAKFLDSEERGFFTTLEKVIAFYSQWEEDYDKGMIAELVSSFFHKEEFRQIIELEKITGNHDVDEFLGRILDPKLQDDFTSSFSQKAVESINCSI